MNVLRQIAFGPVWLLALSVKPLLHASPPWRHQRMTLASWAELGTDYAYATSITFWFCLVFGAFAAGTIAL